MARALIIALIASLAIAGVAAQRKWNTNSGPVAGKLNVHLVPHTHNDVGWLKTVDQYYYGANNTIQNAGVQYIIDSVVAGLQQNPDRKFIYVETGFFARWWREQTPEMQAGVQVLVDNGQLTFINGGWAMHDEASPHYHSMVDQTTFGHQFLLQELGAVPKAGWQIDPFGHSGTQAALLTAEVGFDSLYFARNDYQDYAQRLITSNLEMVWQGSHSLGSSARAFTGVFYGNTYCAPSGFDYNIFGQDPPIMDDPNLEDYNVQQRVDAFVAYVKQQNDGFKTDNIILTMGCDFQYQDALHWYKNLDKLIHYVNLDGRVNAFYSTPDIYTQSKFAANTTWQLKTDDFMPIASNAHSYWTGYFTSRPTLKRWSRHNVQYYPLVRQIAAAANFTNSSVWEPLLDAIGLSSHHDAITGTEKQHVAFDYAKHLSAGRSAVLPTVSKGIDLLIGNSANGNWQECVLANVSVCSLTQNFGVNGTEAGGSFRVLLWNPSSQIRMHTVKIPVAGSTLTVTSPAGASVPAEVVPSSPSFTNYATGSGAPYTLVFEASVAPLGHAVYIITEGTTANTWQGVQYSQTKMVEPTPVGAGDISLSSTYYTLTFSGTTGKLTGIKNLIDGTTQSMTQDWLYYASMANNGQNSGAYIFRPNSTSAYPVGPATVSNDQLVQGALVQSIRQTFGPWVQQTIRLYRTSPLIEIEYTVGAIDISDGVGKEVISRFTSNIQSESQWWVDSNGRDMQYRRRNWRQSWNYTMYEPITGNYYPTVTNLFINDSNAQLTVFTETSQSTSSILDGSVELMAHRRVLYDDNLGVGEPLNETEFISTYDNCNGPMGCGTHYGPGLIHRSKYWLTLTASKTAAQTWRPALDQIFYEPQQFYSDDATSGIQLPTGSLLATSLPANVQVMTLERVNASTILLRLSHQFGAGEDPALSAPVQVDLSTLFSAPGLHYVSYVEMSLTANQFKANMKPLKWNIEGGDTYTQPYRPADVGALVSLSAMQIRTFYVTVN